MAARRLVIVMLILLFVSTLAAALVPAPDSGDEQNDQTTRPAQPTTEPDGRELARTLDAGDKRTPTIRLAPGDQLALTVRSPRPGQVSIAGLGQLEDVHPRSPARFDLLPSEPGSYRVRMRQGNDVLGRIEVVARRNRISESGRTAGRSAGTSRSR